MARLGDTFLLRGLDDHLIIIISEPALDPDRIVTANLTSWRADKDQSCIVQVGEHPFVKKRSCIQYHRDELTTLSKYNSYTSSGRLIPREPVKKALLQRILDGAAASERIPLGNRQILVEQGLIDG